MGAVARGAWPLEQATGVDDDEGLYVGAGPYGLRFLGRRSFLLALDVEHFDPMTARLFWDAVLAAHRIRSIATAAFQRGIRVRWFEFGLPGSRVSHHPSSRSMRRR